jgi:hypothetical protein
MSSFKPGDLIMIHDPDDRTTLVHGTPGLILESVTYLYTNTVCQYNVLIGEEVILVHEEWLRAYV